MQERYQQDKEYYHQENGYIALILQMVWANLLEVYYNQAIISIPMEDLLKTEYIM